ncbi:GNAT family N-acetyltransferase [Raineyella fluvialis]|uniref:GNAT family N-acetyltransferase n=1 Tax=Raineyella fluvialis TaxID=2662261 RepID=A0A5Q2F8R1_9ACTN|nr:GNAT family N-acetyltransferase [Raineyella fluvialis]QGF23058.1 GNAT family N-acetyltransferase [Raineyella fluvialis]
MNPRESPSRPFTAPDRPTPATPVRAVAEGPGTKILPLAALTTAEIIAVYDDLLRPSFRREELPSIGDVLRVYAGDHPAPSGVLLRDGRPLGIHLCETYVDGQVLMLSHLAVASSARGGGIGSQLFDHLAGSMAEISPNAVLLAEIDDPRVWPGTPGTGDPVARLQFYGRHGARLLPMAFVQPQLQPGAGRVAGMFLIRLDRHAHPAPDLLARFLTEYYSVYEGPGSLDDPVLRTLLDAAEGVDLDRDLLPIEDWEQLPRAIG